MTSDATRASGPVLPEINRRRFLISTAAASAISAVPMAAQAASLPKTNDTERDAALFDLLKQHEEAVQAVKKARADLDWLWDEWRHLWPLAPEEILGFANAREHEDSAERDLIGRRIFRDTMPLTKRVARKFRVENKKTCFQIYTAEATEARIAEVLGWSLSGRTEKSRARNAKWRVRYLAELETRLHLARQYEAETSRIRALSNVEAFQATLEAAKQRELSLKDAIYAFPVHTAAGLEEKARFVLETCADYKHMLGAFGLVYGFAEDIRRLRQPDMSA